MLQTIIEMLERDPFQPFRIVMTSGTGYDVTNPHLIALGQSQITVYHPRSDRFSMLRMNQIAAIESLDQAAA